MARKNRKKNNSNFYPGSVGNYDVGYGKVPEHTKFKSGEASPNPSGRPKGSTNFNTVMLKQLRTLVSMREGNKTKKVSKFELLVASLLAHASNGKAPSVNALVSLLELARRLCPEATTAEQETNSPIPKIEITFVRAKPPFAGQIIETDADGNAFTNPYGSLETTIPLPRRS
jgi:hypothetical protein